MGRRTNDSYLYSGFVGFVGFVGVAGLLVSPASVTKGWTNEKV